MSNIWVECLKEKQRLQKELLKCPFCGSDDLSVHLDAGFSYYVWCGNCKYTERSLRMSNKICGKCHIFDDMHDYCIIAGDRHVNSPACDCFVDKCQKSTSPTVFNRITKSPEVLAVELVTLDCDGWWAYVGIGKRKSYPTREEAIAATVAKLKEVAE